MINAATGTCGRVSETRFVRCSSSNYPFPGNVGATGGYEICLDLGGPALRLVTASACTVILESEALLPGKIGQSGKIRAVDLRARVNSFQVHTSQTRAV